MIDLKDAIAMLETGNWVSIAYVGYDRKQRKYGHIIRIDKCRLSRTDTPGTSKHRTPETINSKSKAQNHSEHFTRNVITPSNQIRKVHLALLFQINNLQIL